MTNYRDIPIFINDTGLFARTASVNNSASINKSSFAGNSTASSYPNGPVTTTITLEYLTRLTKDPLIQDVVAFKNSSDNGGINLNPYPFTIRVGNISGSFYLNSVSLNLEANSLISINATLNSFVNISGNGALPSFNGVSMESRDISHSRTLDFINSFNQISDSNIYSFSYSFQKNIIPTFVLGSQFPNRVSCLGASEKSSIGFDTFQEISFTGKYLGEYLNGYDKVVLAPFIKTGVSSSEKITLSLTNQVVSSINTEVNVNDQMKVSIESERSF